MKSDTQNERDLQRDQMIADTMKFVEVVTNHLLPCGDDLTLLTLKGHLVVEHLLETILLRLLAIPETPKKRGKHKTVTRIMPGFYEKLMLVQAVVCERRPGPNADLLIVIDELNWTRNQLAHNLKDQKEIVDHVRKLVAIHHERAGTKPDWSQDLPGLLRDCLICLCRFLFRVRCHFYDLSRQELD